MSTAIRGEANEGEYPDEEGTVFDPKELIAIVERKEKFPSVADTARVLEEVEALGEAARRVRGVPPAWVALREYARTLLHLVRLTLEIHGGEEFRNAPAGVYPAPEGCWLVKSGSQSVEEDREEFGEDSDEEDRKSLVVPWEE